MRRSAPVVVTVHTIVNESGTKDFHNVRRILAPGK